MNRVRVLGAALCSLMIVLGCAEPAQLGGLGVLNPNGLAGRMALAGRVNGAAAETNGRAEATKGQDERNPLRPSECHDSPSR